MKRTKLLTAFGLLIAGSALVAQATEINWAGGTGAWTNTANWVEGSVPVTTNGTDDAVISSGTAQYNGFDAGGDLTFAAGSQLVLDGGTYEQTTTHYMRFNGGTLDVSDGGFLSNACNRLWFYGAAMGTVDGASTVLKVNGSVVSEALSILSITDGATGTIVSGNAEVWSGGQINVSGASVLAVNKIIANGSSNGVPSMVNLSDSAIVNMVAGTDAISGDSFVNLETGYIGYLQIVGINESELEDLIAGGAFGINGTIDTALASYQYTSNTDAVNIGLVEPPLPPFHEIPRSTGIITINVTDGGAGDGDASASNIGGVVPGAYIETVAQGEIAKNDTNVGDLRDSSGSYSGISMAVTAGAFNPGGWAGEGSSGFNAGSANMSDVMMENFCDTDDGTLTFSGLSDWLAETGATSYEVYVMSDRPYSQVTIAAFTVASQTYWLATDGADAAHTGPFKQSTAVDAAEATADPAANYVKFTGLTGDSFDLNIARNEAEGGIGWINLCGIQIVAVQSVAEPIGSISIETVPEGVSISWDSTLAQPYDVQSKSNLITQLTWSTITNVTGSGSSMAVTVPAEDAEAFYQVVTP